MMTIAEQLKVIGDALRDWAQSNRGTVILAPDLAHLVSGVLAQRPGGVVAYVVFTGETPRGELAESPQDGRADRAFTVVLSRGKMLKLEEGSTLLGAGDAKGTLDLIEEARETLRKIVFTADTEEDSVASYKGTKAFQPIDGILTDAWQFDFTVPAQLPVY